MILRRIQNFLNGTIFLHFWVCRSFDPRRECCNRTYYYLLPATAIDITLDSNDEEIQQKISRFQDILSSFEVRIYYSYRK